MEDLGGGGRRLRRCGSGVSATKVLGVLVGAGAIRHEGGSSD